MIGALSKSSSSKDRGAKLNPYLSLRREVGKFPLFVSCRFDGQISSI